MRPLDELAVPEDSAWPALAAAVERSSVGARAAPADPDPAAQTLVRLQVTTRSVLGALAFHCGGLVVDSGWLRILGGGSPGLPDLVTANGLQDAVGPPPFLLVAYDVLGGRFAVDGGGLGVAPGEVCYWGPDTLAWTGLGAGHAAFVHWAVGGEGLAEFYASLRWDGWERVVREVPLSHGLSVLPPPFARGDDTAPSRQAIPFAEVLGFYDEMARRLTGYPDGTAFSLHVVD
jgi:hypothetical protein